MRMHDCLAVSFDLAPPQRDSSLTPFAPGPWAQGPRAQNDTYLLLLASTCPQNQTHLDSRGRILGKSITLSPPL